MADIQESDKKNNDYKKGSAPSANKKDFRVQEETTSPMFNFNTIN